MEGRVCVNSWKHDFYVDIVPVHVRGRYVLQVFFKERKASFIHRAYLFSNTNANIVIPKQYHKKCYQKNVPVGFSNTSSVYFKRFSV